MMPNNIRPKPYLHAKLLELGDGQRSTQWNLDNRSNLNSLLTHPFSPRHCTQIYLRKLSNGFFFLLQLVNQYYTKEYYTNLVLVQIFIENVFKRPRKYDVYKAMITRTSTHVASFLAKMLPLLQKSLIKTRF